MKKYIIFSFIFLVIGFAIAFAFESDKSPEEVIQVLEDAIEKAEKEGNYRCCIEPACDMCFLGHWKFEKGMCFCDDAIREGRDDDVCPQCVKGIEEGRCTSTDVVCEVNLDNLLADNSKIDK